MKNLAQKSNNFEEAEKAFAYAIWMVEKEFHVGFITEDTLMMKFWNLLNEENSKRYSDSMKKNSTGEINTFG